MGVSRSIDPYAVPAPARARLHPLVPTRCTSRAWTRSYEGIGRSPSAWLGGRFCISASWSARASRQPNTCTTSRGSYVLATKHTLKDCARRQHLRPHQAPHHRPGLLGWTIFEILRYMPEHNWSVYEEALKINPVLAKMMVSGVVCSLGSWIAQKRHGMS